MKSNNFVVIQGWMCNELELKGNELLIFALIYGFSQDEVSKFHGTRKYIAETFNISRPTVDKALQSLLEKQYICKEGFDDFVNPNVYWVNFEVVKKLYMGCKETLQGGCKETLLNNTNKQTTNKKEKSNSKELLQNSGFEFGKQKPKKENLYTKCLATIKTFTQDEMLRDYLKTFLDLRLEIARSENKSFYFGMWTHLLSELKQLAVKDGELNTELAKDIVNTSTMRGWKHFYELTDNGYVRNTNVRSESGARHVPSMTEEDYIEEEKRLAELEAKGVQVRF